MTTTCPNCSREVESGFKFCDYCGTNLASTEPAKESEPKPARKPFFARRRDKPAGWTPEDQPVRVKVPRSAPEDGPSTEPQPPKQPEPPKEPTPGFVSKPMTVAELKEKGVGIAGRLRWREGEAPPGPEDTNETPIPVPAPPPTPAWSKVEEPAPPKRSSVAEVAAFVFHLVLSFAVGAALLAIAAVVASLTSDGSVALLEVRGLPILIAGATAIIVFSLLRTGPRPGRSRRSVVASVALGFLILVAASAGSYQPSLMSSAQRRLDRSLGVFGAEAEAAVDQVTADVDQWNAEVNNYRIETLTPFVKTTKTEPDAAKVAKATRTFEVAASGSEEALDGIHKRMVSHAAQIDNIPLRDAVRDLAGVFGDELSGIRLITRASVTNDTALLAAGNTRFKDATARVVELFEERVLPILERAEIDPSPLELSVEELRGAP